VFALVVMAMGFAALVIELAATLAAISELAAEAAGGGYSKDALVTTAFLLAYLFFSRQSWRLGEGALDASGAEGAAQRVAAALVAALFKFAFAAVYLLPAFGVHPPARFMEIFNALFPAWLALNIAFVAVLAAFAFVALFVLSWRW